MNMSLLREKYQEIARLVIRHHTSMGPCLFAPAAVGDIADAALAAAERDPSPRAVQAALVTAIEAAEIYCPHEGIDRRAEFGIAA